MDFIKRLVFILALTTILSLNSANCAEISTSKIHHATISSIKFVENDILNSKDNEYNLTSTQNNQTLSSSRRNKDNQGSSSNDNLIEPTKQKQTLISYIHNQAYLDDKNELALLLLLHQIQPNAP